MVATALFDVGEEILIPSPSYSLWTNVTYIAGAKPVLYLCDEKSDWYPDVEDIRRKITPKTKALLLINPNNPTGAVYPEYVLRQIVDLARRHGLIIFADEIYEKILYDGAVHINAASLTGDDVLCLTFSGLSKAYRIAGFRSGWMTISGPKREAADYIEGINLLANMRLCANVPAQHAIQTALGGYQSINDLILPGGRLKAQRDLAYKMLNDIPGVSVENAEGALYLFPKLDPEAYPIESDEMFALDLLKQQKILVSHGTAFNWIRPDHFRMVTLPALEDIEDAISRLAEFLSTYKPSTYKP